MLQWLQDNKEWLFSGVGGVVLLFLLQRVIKKASASKQIQKSGKNSNNYQAGADININNKTD